MDEVKSLDTYALIEISKENPSFAKYVSSSILLNDLTLAEFFHVVLREEGEPVAEYWLKKFEAYSIAVPKELLIEAIKFRKKHKEKNFSFFDAVGYVFALKNKTLFVTGDKEFEHMLNVEFKKK